MKMKLTLPLTVALLVAFSIVTLSRKASASTNAGPKLVIAALEHSFGKVQPGTPLTHSFKVRNEGQADLEIKSVSPACGCTAAHFDKLVSPGKEGVITLKIENTAEYRGEIVKTAAVTSNDPNQQTFTLTLRANFTTQ
jgi:hypothetical protein